MVGGKSSSNSTSNANQTDNRVGADGGSIAIGSNANVDFIDPGAFEFGEVALRGAFETAQELIGTTGNIASDSLSLVEKTQRQMIGFAESRTQSEETNLAQQALKIALPVAVMAVVVAGLRKGVIRG